MPRHVFRKAILRIAFLVMLLTINLFGVTSCSSGKQTITLAGANSFATNSQLNYQDESFYETMNVKKTEVINEHMVRDISLSVVGDIMFHDTQLLKAYDVERNLFDFDGIFRYMKPFLEKSSLTFGNLETTLYGPYGSTTSASDNNVYGYSGYPMFNTPDSVLDTILDAGFDFLSTANNHSLDRHYDGMIRTIEKLDKAGLLHTGTFTDLSVRKPYEIIEVEGVTLAVVSYTYATNGVTMSDERMKLINTLDYYVDEEIEKLYLDVEAADESGADLVIVMLHYGNEYQSKEDSGYQRPITKEVLKRGGDIVFGGHPHVMQPIDVFYELDGVVFEEPKVIIYSLGNFISSQRNINKLGGNTDLGVMFSLYFQTVNGGAPKLKGIGLLPTFTTWQSDVITTIPVLEEEVLFDNTGLSYGDYLTFSEWDNTRMAFAKEYTLQHLMQYVLPKNYFSQPYEYLGSTRYDFIDQ